MSSGTTMDDFTIISKIGKFRSGLNCRFWSFFWSLQSFSEIRQDRLRIEKGNFLG